MITAVGVSELQHNGTKYEIRYELVELTEQEEPKYIAVYTIDGWDNEAVYISTNFRTGGPKARLFSIWPGIVKHHRQFGNGKTIRLDVQQDVVSDSTHRRAFFLD